jgi:hypothetical protein
MVTEIGIWERNKRLLARNKLKSVVSPATMPAMSDYLLNLPFLSQPPAAAAGFGFRFGAGGGHGSRTLMLDELSALLDAVHEGELNPEELRRLCVYENVLGKPTSHTRGATLQRLREMHGLDQRLTLFRVFHQLWRADEAARPLLAMTLALARDPIFRVSSAVILKTTPGEPVPRELFLEVFQKAYRCHYKDSMLDKLVRHVASSWCQTGHMRGRVLKVRQRAAASPAAAAFALTAGYLMGLRGRLLFATPFAALLDADESGLLSLARAAHRHRLLTFREAGDVVELTFPNLLTTDEHLLSHGQS